MVLWKDGFKYQLYFADNFKSNASKNMLVIISYAELREKTANSTLVAPELTFIVNLKLSSAWQQAAKGQ